MESDNEFEKITVQDLIADDAFLRWVNQPDKALEDHWKGVVDKRPDMRPVIEEARTLVSRMRFAEHRAPAERKRLVLDRIKEEAGIGQEERVKTVSIRRWVQVAASLSLFMLAGIWLYTRYSGKPTGGLGGSPQVASSFREGRIFLSDGRSFAISEQDPGTLVEEDGMHLVLASDGLRYRHALPGSASLQVDSVISPVAQVFQLTLPDGSEVWMNSGSTLRLSGQYSTAKRGVDMTGQCYFSIVPESGVPFSVTVDNREVTVLGTQFDVSNYPGTPKTVTLVEGSVRLSGSAMSPVLLKPGQQATAEGDGSPVIAEIDVKRVIAWKDGTFAFQNQTIEEVMGQLALWYGVAVVYEGPKPELPISGSIPSALSLEDALAILQATGIDAAFEVHGGNTVKVVKLDTP